MQPLPGSNRSHPPCKKCRGGAKNAGGGGRKCTPADFAGVNAIWPAQGPHPCKVCTPCRKCTPANFAPGTVNEPEDSTSLLKDKDSVGVTPDLFAADKAKSAPKRQRATGERIPPDFTVDADMRKWAAEKIPGFNIDVETENFIDYWKGRADSGALKADWAATWRTWMRRAAKDRSEGPRVVRE